MIFSSNTDILETPEGYQITLKKESDLKTIAVKNKNKVNITIKKPVTAGSEEQNRACHALLQAYYLTNCHSAPEGSTFDDFRIYMKAQYGPKIEMEVMGNRITVLKSWADYSKAERSDFISAVIAEIEMSGASAEPKIQEILKGMAENSKIKTGG